MLKVNYHHRGKASADSARRTADGKSMSVVDCGKAGGRPRLNQQGVRLMEGRFTPHAWVRQACHQQRTLRWTSARSIHAERMGKSRMASAKVDPRHAASAESAGRGPRQVAYSTWQGGGRAWLNQQGAQPMEFDAAR